MKLFVYMYCIPRLKSQPVLLVSYIRCFDIGTSDSSKCRYGYVVFTVVLDYGKGCSTENQPGELRIPC